MKGWAEEALAFSAGPFVLECHTVSPEGPSEQSSYDKEGGRGETSTGSV